MKTKTTFSLLAMLFVLQGLLFAQKEVKPAVVAPTNAATAPAAANPVMPAVLSAPAPAAPAAPVPGGGIFTFETDTHQFGEMQQGGDASWTFKFTNTGTEAIKIEQVKPQCGCTTPKEWPREPIMPGQSGEIMLKYDSNRVGGFDKFVTIISNASEVDKKLYIKGNILAKPADPTFTAPGNEGPVAAPQGH